MPPKNKSSTADRKPPKREPPLNNRLDERSPTVASAPPVDAIHEVVRVIAPQEPLHTIPERVTPPLSRNSPQGARSSESPSDRLEGRNSGAPLQLDPMYSLSQHTHWSKTRRQRISMFAESRLRILTCYDPMVDAFVIEREDEKKWSAVVGCVNYGSSDALVDIGLAFSKVSGDVIIESELINVGGPKIPWSREELTGSPILKLVVPQFGSTYRLFKSVDSLQGRYASELLVASLARGGAFARREIETAVRDESCEQLDSLVNRLCVKGHFEPHEVLAQILKAAPEVDVTRLMAKLSKISLSKEGIASRILFSWKMGPIMLTTPELGKWSTFGGLGVMVDDLINTLTDMSEEVWAVSPYYERNRKGETGYLAKDNITWSFNIEVDIGIERVTVGVYETTMNGIRYFFLHNAKYFPSIYPHFSPVMMTAFLVLMAKCPLEICCQLHQFPSTVVTNDWATGLTAAYAKRGVFGCVFSETKFMHIVHNLDKDYEGRMFPQKYEDVGKVHMLPSDLLVDPHWERYCVNPSRCAILCSDNWGTVSVSYRKELMAESALAPILRLHAHPFAHPNGIPVESRLARLRATNMSSHWEAKAAIQKKYFTAEPNPETVLLGFVGRITFQKGIHLILDIAEQLLRKHSGGVQIVIGGAANPGEQYALHCAQRMRELGQRFPDNFWADPDAFFVDGPLLNFGADFGLMPSAFEPGGIVQQEFLVAGTPVIAFKTGGLRDTICEFYNGVGNGFTFEAHTAGDLAYAVERALKLFWGDENGYELLRENARKSVVTCDMVARAWLKEFYRMHNKVYVDKAEMERIMTSIPDMEHLIDVEYSETEPESIDSSSEEDAFDRFSWSGLSVATPTSTMASRSMSREWSIPGMVRRSVRVTFNPKSMGNLPRSVLLAGSFDQWASRTPLRWDKTTRVFYVVIRVPQGKWQIKLIVDGTWTCIDDYPIEKDSEGNLNNVILVD